MTSLLAMMAVCMPASTIDINSAPTWPVAYAQDCECPCDNSGRIGGVWLNYYSPCRCDTTIVLLTEPFPLPPLRDDPQDTQFHPILHPSVYSPSLNPFFVFDLFGNLIHPHHDHLLDHHFLNNLNFGVPNYHFNDASLKIPVGRFSDIGHNFVPTASTVIPEPGTLALLAVGITAVVRRRRKAA